MNKNYKELPSYKVLEREFAERINMNKEKMKQVFCKDCFYANHRGNTPYSSIVNECLAMGKEKKHPVYGVWLEYPDCEVVNKNCKCKLFKPANFKSKWRNHWND